jgi:hypothetical protein
MRKLYILLSALLILTTAGFVSSDWIEFAVDKELTIKLPGQPTTIRRDTIEADGFESHVIISSYNDETGWYRVCRDDLNHESDNYLTPQGRKEWYMASPITEGMLYQAKFLKRETFEINGIDGVDRVYDLPASTTHGHTIKYIRSLLVGKVAYDFWFIPKQGLTNPDLAHKKRFFNSIKLKN